MDKYNLKEHLKLNNNNKRLIDELKEDKLPVVVWGAGSMSYNLRKMLKHYGVSVNAIWVDGQISNSIIDDIPVLGFDTISKQYPVFNVVCGHSKYDLAQQIQKKYHQINRVFCFVNICYGLWEGISTEYINNHLKEYTYSYNCLEDEKSRKCFAAYLNCKNNEDYNYLMPCCKDENVAYFDNPFFKVSDHEVYLDVGAYDGDTLKEFLGVVDNKFDKIIAIEPEMESYTKLSEYVKQINLKNIECYNNCCSDDNKELMFSLDKESSSLGSEGIIVKAYRIDEQFSHEKISLIKINFLIGVEETLIGASKILKTLKPNLAITVGFDEKAIMNIPKLIKEMNHDYKLSLRFASPMPARLILFAY